MSEYKVEVYDILGNRKIATIDAFYLLDYARRVNDIGALRMLIPPNWDNILFFNNDIIEDLRFVINRSNPNNPSIYNMEMEQVWLLRYGSRAFSEYGVTELICEDLNGLLHRRIVAYDSASAEANKSDLADDMMKEIVSENMGASAPADRDLSLYLSIEGDQSQAPSINKGFSRRILIEVFKELAQSSLEAGTFLAFDVIANSPKSKPIFRTYTGQRGLDRRFGVGINPVLLSIESGNLANAKREHDHQSEVTYAYAGGQGEGASRAVGTASDPIRIARSPFGRIETFIDARMTTDSAALDDDASSAIRQGQPRQIFSGRIVETPSTKYGVQFGFGDYVSTSFKGEVLDCRIDALRVTVDRTDIQKGTVESIEVTLRRDA